jgi:hypothetical protein
MIANLGGNRAILGQPRWRTPYLKSTKGFNPDAVFAFDLHDGTSLVEVDWTLKDGDFYVYTYAPPLLPDAIGPIIDALDRNYATAPAPYGGYRYNAQIRNRLVAKL